MGAGAEEGAGRAHVASPCAPDSVPRVFRMQSAWKCVPEGGEWADVVIPD